jgi:DNA-3-methyladenine glycosylase
MRGSRLPSEFFTTDVLTVAPGLIGKTLLRIRESGEISEHIITETEAYRGIDDKACHASKGRTPRTEVMFESGGVLYMYLIYGMYWMLNVVTSVKDVPQAVLIRGIEDVSGPGRLTRSLALDKSFNGEELFSSERIWIEDSNVKSEYTTHPRIGVDYAGEYWKNKRWRFLIHHRDNS